MEMQVPLFLTLGTSNGFDSYIHIQVHYECSARGHSGPASAAEELSSEAGLGS